MTNQVNDMPLGSLLIGSGLADAPTLSAAHEHARRHGRPLVESLVGSDHVDEGELARIMAERLKLPRVSLDGCQPEVEATALISADECRKHLVFPVEVERKAGFQFLVLAMANPLNNHSLRAVHGITRLRVRPLVAQASDVCSAIARTYRCAFEPLMGMGADDLSAHADETIQGPLEPGLGFFDQVENILGPYVTGIDDSLETKPDARAALEACLNASLSVRDKLVLNALLQLIDTGLLDPLRLLSETGKTDS